MPEAVERKEQVYNLSRVEGSLCPRLDKQRPVYSTSIMFYSITLLLVGAITGNTHFPSIYCKPYAVIDSLPCNYSLNKLI